MEKIKKVSQEELIEHIQYWLGKECEKNDFAQIYAMVISLVDRLGFDVE